MPGWRAARLCPELVFVPGHFREYQRLGDAVMNVLADVTPEAARSAVDASMDAIRTRFGGDAVGYLPVVHAPCRISSSLPAPAGAGGSE